jgi:hypothetical protein
VPAALPAPGGLDEVWRNTHALGIPLLRGTEENVLAVDVWTRDVRLLGGLVTRAVTP